MYHLNASKHHLQKTAFCFFLENYALWNGIHTALLFRHSVWTFNLNSIKINQTENLIPRSHPCLIAW